MSKNRQPEVTVAIKDIDFDKNNYQIELKTNQGRILLNLLPDDAPGHTGFTGTSVWLDPNHDSIFVLLTNRVHPRVPAQDFQEIRRGFHAAADRMTRDGGSPQASSGESP